MKAIKRKELKQLRNSLENKKLLSNLIEKSFVESDFYKNSEVLLLYYSVGSEVATDGIFRKALIDKKRVAFPVCVDTNGNMQFYYINDESDLEEGMYGIKAPKNHCKKFTCAENALCIVPGLSFDKKGYRLGYGKGYYDRFLGSFEGISVGLSFECLVCDALPTDEHDKKVDCLITDKRIYKFK